jgi:branched-chain amino acid transport system substrate-binding protein
MSRTRSQLLGTLVTALGLAMVVTACSAPPGDSEAGGTKSAGSSSSSAEQPSTTNAGQTGRSTAVGTTSGGGSGGIVKVGFLSPVTGTVAAAGTEMREGWELYWEQHNNSAGSLTLQTVYEDDAGNPDTALSKAKRLIEDEKVQVMVGPLLANSALAVSDYVTGQGIPSLQPVTAADDLTQRKQNPLMLRAGAYAGSQMNFPGGQWAYDEGYRTAVTLCPDYAFGWESCGGFVKGFVSAGGKVTKQLWFPLGTSDFSTYVNQLGSADADMAYVAVAGGADGPRFIKTYSDFGLTDKLPMLSNCCMTDQAILRDAGAAAEGILSVSYYAEGRQSPSMDKFIEGYQGKYNKLPGLYAAGSYLTAEVLDKALQATGSADDGAALIKAAQSVTFEDSLYGPLKFDAMNNPVGPVYVRKVEKNSDGQYWNVPIKTYDEVNQFWTFDKDDYLKNPPFSRDYTGQ